MQLKAQPTSQAYLKSPSPLVDSGAGNFKNKVVKRVQGVKKEDITLPNISFKADRTYRDKASSSLESTDKEEKIQMLSKPIKF